LSHSSSENAAKGRANRLLTELESTISPEKFEAAREHRLRFDLDATVCVWLMELGRPNQDTFARTTAQALSDPLTEREMEVLRFIAEGLSNHDIAVQLFVGVSTVKTHINHLFSKLCVKNRTQAVARARELSLLP
jgi:ATP/maltotriose-dependent transcriptional regulator MalT